MTCTPSRASGLPSGPIENGTTYIVRPRIGSVEEALERRAHVGRVVPVVGRAGVLFALAADEGARLDAGDVVGVAAGQEAVGAVLGVELGHRAVRDQEAQQLVLLAARSVDPDDRVGRGEVRHLLDPGDDARVGALGRQRPGRVVDGLEDLVVGAAAPDAAPVTADGLRSAVKVMAPPVVQR